MPERITPEMRQQLPPDLQNLSEEELIGRIKEFAQKRRPSTLTDVVRGYGTGVRQGIESTIGAARDIPDLLTHYAGKAADYAGVPESVQSAFSTAADFPKMFLPPSARDVHAATSRMIGENYEPQTVAGEYARTAGQFTPGALLPGSATSRLLNVALPAVGAETAGQFAREVAPEYENTARFVGGLAAGAPAAAMGGVSSVESVVANAGRGLTPAQANQARQIMLEARNVGVPITWPEAIQQATQGGTGMGNLQRVVEGSGNMQPYFAQRPGQVAAAGGRAMQDISPNPRPPEVTGPAVQEAGQRSMQRLEQEINRVTRPLYDQAAPNIVNPGLTTSDYYNEIVRSIQNDVRLPRALRQADPNSVEMVDAVQKIMAQEAARAGLPEATGLEHFAGSNIGQMRDNIIQQAEAAAPTYGPARRQQAQLREQYLNPLEQGPLGKVSGTSDVSKQGQGMFPKVPAAGSERGVATAVRRLAREDPQAALDLVRQHVETTFNQATRTLATGGDNQFGGARFVSALIGNPQTRRNLEAAIRALPDGDVRWNGMVRFLRVLEATGQRQRPGSMTSFNTDIMKQLESGTITMDALTKINPVTFVADAYQRYRLGQGLDRLARVFTDPEAFDDLQAMMQSGRRSQQAANSAMRLILRSYLGTEGDQR